MKLLKKSTLGLALTAAMTGGAMMGVSTPVQAVDIAHDGLGQALVFPYYTTRNGWNTYFNITNTSDKTVAMKVRWREAMNSRDVRDFVVVMSPHDVWTAAVVNGADGAKMVTTDKTCTVPKLPTDADKGIPGVDFTNTAYIKKGVNDNRDKGPEDLDRTREGYFEVIEMGVANEADAAGGAIAAGALHVQSGGNNAGTPAGCDAINTQFATNLAGVQAGFNAPENVLKGRAVLINAAAGLSAGYDPLVLKDFAQGSIVSGPANEQPSLADADAFDAAGNPVVDDPAANGQNGVKAVEDLIMRSSVINDYNIAGTSETDWILTFPTKNFRVDQGFDASANFAAIPYNADPNAAHAPFAPFKANAAPNAEAFSSVQAGKACFDVTAAIYDREEYKITGSVGNDFSPAEPGVVGDQLCYEANIVSFGDSDLFTSKVRKSLGNLPADNGWAEIGFGGAPLPVVGMRIEKRNKGDASVNYSFANDHAYKK